MRPFFSLIIPCFNSEPKRIQKLFDSLTRQGIDQNELEIIVVDDNSEDKSYLDIVNQYDVIFTETDTDIHCPGNTRRKGMEYVTGQWLFFADHDDYFEDGVLKNIKDYINAADHDIYCISTIANEYNDETGEYIQTFKHKNTWLHGKWYNVDRLIKPLNVNFMLNLITNEDVFFNCLILDKLIIIDKDYDYLNINTYRWVENPNSISHVGHVGYANSKRGYLYDGFGDYLFATTQPYWEDALRSRIPELIRQIELAILHGYFYYELATYYYGGTNYADILQILNDLIVRFLNDFKYDAIKLIDDIYSDPAGWALVREHCEYYRGVIIPKTSFRDFIFKLLLDL